MPKRLLDKSHEDTQPELRFVANLAADPPFREVLLKYIQQQTGITQGPRAYMLCSNVYDCGRAILRDRAWTIPVG